MDHRQLRKRLAERLALTPEEIDSLTEGLSILMRDCCGDLDTIAIPTFGKFEPLKSDEIVQTDASTGRRMLMPPEITLHFYPGGMLRKHILGHE